MQFDKLGIPQKLQRAIKADLSKSNTDEAFGALRFDDNLYLINLIDGEIKAKKLMTVHKKMDEAGIELFRLAMRVMVQNVYLIILHLYWT